MILRCFRSTLSLLLAAAALLFTPLARAVSSNDIMPANMIGRTLTMRYNPSRSFETNLSLSSNIFYIQLLSATTYLRSGSGTPGIVTEGGTYTVVSTSEREGIRTTVLSFNTNFTRPGDTVPVTISMQSVTDEIFTSNFTLTQSGTGASATGYYYLSEVDRTPAITSPNTATAVSGQPFTYQITATNTPTSYRAVAVTAIPSLAVSNTGLVSATFPAAGQYSFNAFASNASGSASIRVLVTVSGAPVATPVVTSATQVNATVGTPFTYNITTAPAATSYVNAGGNAPIAINPATGVVTGTFTTAGTYTFSFTALNGTGSSPVTTVTVTATGSNNVVVEAPNIGAFAGTYSGQQFSGIPGPTATNPVGDFVATVTPGGVLTAQAGTLTGRVDASGNVTFDASGSNLAFGYTTGRIENNRLTATGQLTIQGRLIATYRIDAPRTAAGATASAIAAPANLVGYRNRVGQTFEFTITGASGGVVWGTDVYTDDSSVTRAAVHAGVVAVGQTKTVAVTILPGQSSYASSARNGVSSASWGSWSGSYSFAGGGILTGTATASARPALAPGFVTFASTISAGGRLVLPIAVNGGGTYTYQWFLNGVAIAGATANPYVIESVRATHAGAYTVDVTNSLGTTRLTAGSVTITSVGAPVIALQPISKTVSPGGTFTMATNASGAGNAYQWFRNGVALAGETGAILLRQNVTASDAGEYTVRITNSAGSVMSAAGTITLSPTASRPANISVRANVAAGQNIIPGISVSGVGSKRIIVRAVGPGLSQFGVTGIMSDPKLELFRGSTKIGENDNWDGASATTTAFASVGAFGLTAGSRDAVLVTELTAGQNYTVVVSGASGSSGIVLIEVYDADAPATSTSRLTNVSVRGSAGTDASTLILGFVLGGQGQRTLLVRGVGPQLAAFGVTGTLADPRFQIYDSEQRAVLANDNWGQADFLGELVQATSYVGAFALEPNSRDAATLTLLNPGAYTIHLSGAGTTTGEALVEVYEVP